MPQWISRLRTRKARSRLKQADWNGAPETAPVVNRYLPKLLLALLGWLATCMLLFAGQPWPADPLALAQMAGDVILLLLGVAIAGAFLYISDAPLLRGNSRPILLLIILGLFTLVPVRLLLVMADTAQFFSRPVAEFLFPLALGPLLATILIGSGAGVVLGLWTSYAAAVCANHSLAVLTTGLIATGIAACAARNVRKRSRVFKLGLMIGIAQIYVVVALAAFQPGMPENTLRQALACLVGGTLTALIVLLILPLFETVFGISTDITLLELSDLAQPLLQRLATEAPGTYHHSLVAASLGQAAADEIGANALLVRVGAYFHDIGKLTKPEMFTENIPADHNPHANLAPNMSALLITAHVKEGISFAMLSKLPRVLIDMIQQHHGTSVVTYFHRKAREQLSRQLQDAGAKADGGSTINDGDFRYPGPKPSTREAAILMLADVVEAASRSLAKPTPQHIRNLVEDIFQDKLRDGQLDMCPLTLDELKRVKEAFIFTQISMFHSRIPYPKDENRNQQPADA